MMRRCEGTLALAIVVASGCTRSSTMPSPSSPGISCPVGLAVAAPQSGWPCPPSAALREIDAEVALQFLADPTSGELVCHAADGSADLTSLQERIYQALYLMKRLEFDQPLPWTHESLWRWFVAAVRGIRLVDSAVSSCCNPPGVINISIGRGPFDRGFPTPIFVLVHEARHADGNYPHRCGGSGLQTTKDVAILDMGAFGVQYFLGKWIAGHAISPLLTAEDRRYTDNASDLLRTSAFCMECGGPTATSGR
jgi:hypothetical protein